MDTKKLIELASTSLKEVAKYRSNTINLLSSKKHQLRELKSLCERLKTIPDASTDNITKKIDECEKEIEDLYQTLNIISNWKF